MRAPRRQSARSRAGGHKATGVVPAAVAASVNVKVQVVALGSWWATMKIDARQVKWLLRLAKSQRALTRDLT